MALISSQDLAHSIATLKQWLPFGAHLFTILRSVSRSGMSREISVVVWTSGNVQPIHPNFHVARVLGLRMGKRDGVIVNGAGMDMGFDLAHRLGELLHGDGYAFTQEWL